MSNDDDESVCRMCHSEGEPDRPLFYPCKCSGSIRYVHQDCLIQWLKVKSKSLTESKCELCGEKYKFRNIYKSGYPSTLGIIEFLLALIPMLLYVVIYICQCFVFIILWIIGLPLMTCMIHDAFTNLLINSAAPRDYVNYQPDGNQYIQKLPRQLPRNRPHSYRSTGTTHRHQPSASTNQNKPQIRSMAERVPNTFQCIPPRRHT